MRTTLNINQDWKFCQAEVAVDAVATAEWQNVNVPHTWNDKDGREFGTHYYRGVCAYVKNFARPAMGADDEMWLEFKGVNSSCTVYLNGKEVCKHDGGYSTFRANVTEYVQDENELFLRVDNLKNETVYPQTADFTFYGGIYRDVNIIVVPKQHFDLSFFGSCGVWVAGDMNGDVTVNSAQTAGEATFAILDAEGKKVAEGKSGETVHVEGAHLWAGVKDPYLYTAKVSLTADGEVKDELCIPFGFRTFAADRNGFILNGERYPLRGVCRHQDRKDMGNAITKKEHDEDMDIIREMGANTIRLAHYQHDDYFYELCDKYGMVAWAEIPYISRHMPEANENAVQQLKELIYQQYNHASIAVWSISNEITMYNVHKKDMLETHKRLNDICHELDKTRLSTLACYAVATPFDKVSHITDTVSWNLYFGWYVPFFWLNELWFGFFRLLYPNLIIGLSEYGAEAMPNLHSSHSKIGDNSEEYQAKYHEYLLRFIEKTPYLWATHVWNMYDFAADGRNQGGEPNMNHKGLVTFDRKIKKDSFYLYKAYWSNDPFVHIAGKRYQNRETKKLALTVYTNQKEIEVYVNGKLFKTMKGNRVFKLKVPMTATTEIEVRSGELKDTATFNKVDKFDEDYRLHVKSVAHSWQNEQ